MCNNHQFFVRCLYTSTYINSLNNLVECTHVSAVVNLQKKNYWLLISWTILKNSNEKLHLRYKKNMTCSHKDSIPEMGYWFHRALIMPKAFPSEWFSHTTAPCRKYNVTACIVILPQHCTAKVFKESWQSMCIISTKTDEFHYIRDLHLVVWFLFLLSFVLC